MNILPKKRWHVRNRENIARVRRDEAEAADEERKRQERIRLAEKEARRSLLLERSRELAPNKAFKSQSDQELEALPTGHVNFFEDLQKGTAELKEHNVEHEKEKKEEREKYEKQIGYLTYLGQDTNEALGKKSWYAIAPDRSNSKGEVNMKSKIREDPLQIMQKFTTIPKKKESNSKDRSKSKHTSSNSRKDGCDNRKQKNQDDEKQQKLELLRAKRLKRENEERIRAEMLLSKVNGKCMQEDKAKNVERKPIKARYNSQFNPELARQNYM
ncbi:hypothetical protein JTB14_025044 [Gonioctena quinquepunctata]|nr:hypothetical protein JTB14_025044 [Gonioctena quinquepunctata]